LEAAKARGGSLFNQQEHGGSCGRWAKPCQAESHILFWMHAKGKISQMPRWRAGTLIWLKHELNPSLERNGLLVNFDNLTTPLS
jgi:hypothetical protein